MMASDKTKSSVKQQIEENLKRVYDEALQEDVPDELSDMIKRFQAEKARIDKAKSNE
ncbi:NepR family anti-sigma factor [Rhodobacteraceae bacterium]|nr:NepR family anti-sigma factor [Paracoccaceae bacterium]